MCEGMYMCLVGFERMHPKILLLQMVECPRRFVELLPCTVLVL